MNAKSRRPRVRGRSCPPRMAAVLIVALSALPGAQAGVHTNVAPRLTAGLEIGQLKGDSGFQVSIPHSFRSRVEFPVEGTFLAVEGVLQLPVRIPSLSTGLAVRGRYQRSIALDGDTTDADFDERDALYQWTRSDTDGDAVNMSVDLLVYADTHLPTLNRLLRTSLVLGYVHDHLDYDARNVLGRSEYGASSIALAGPAATYEQTMSGVRIGINMSLHPVSWLNLDLEALAIPRLEAETDAYWMLRNYEFQQEAVGQAYSVAARTHIHLTPRLQLLATYRHVQLVADQQGYEDGNNDGFVYANYPIVDEIWNKHNAYEVALHINF